ncbi:hypothetical protein Leryth_002865 [Lithospermum erythrorhizon]|nr:hypothetical protein Leryth_002865 [Lithospermum erythrorhizon]
MATQFPFPQITPIKLLILLLLSFPTTPIFGINITSLLSPFPDLSDFSSLLTTTGVAADLLHRSAVTILAIPNSPSPPLLP